MTQPNPSHVRAGVLAARVLNEACKEVKPGVKVSTICSLAERRTIELGARPAFPCNVSVQHIAAHYTSPKSDTSVIPESGLVKVDVGAQIDGYIADTARTVDLDGTLEGLVVATDDALNEAIAVMVPGNTLGEVGRTIEKVIRAYGIVPVKELSGHSMLQYKLHAGKRVPNVHTHDSTPIEVGECYAIEPFATSGIGIVDSKNTYIFSNTDVDRPLSGVTEKLRLHLRKKYGPFPFASRWVGTSDRSISVEAEFNALLHAKAIRPHPVLVEKKGRPVSQSEHTVFITEEGPRILTKAG
ncbi:MAG: type II methionyl aminopeptidase [Candidatus Thorarchaeota archaeon]|nr:type II methionyl aminopeptidase [Candidatus Thorarchaeota archaeon]